MTEGDDRRWHIRRVSRLQARVIINDRSPALECTVRDLSARGARLVVATSCALPSTFELELPNLQLRVKARLVWSRAEQHGVMFVWPQQTART